ncbi:lysophospholipid acyltransferase [Kappamyces sp. JEL0680]|nr:lysophospholipid acyltransferase [Kappamyces sp. JEL0680]
MEGLIASTGLSGEVVRFGLGLLISFPLSLLYPFIPASWPNARHWFSFVTTSATICAVFRISAFVELLSLCLGVYVLALTFRAKTYGAVLVFSAALAHMAYLHLENQIWRVDDETYVDYSAMMMVLLIKLSSFGWNVYDGTKTGEKAERLDSYQVKMAVKTYPTLIEFLGYCFFINGVWVGPAIEYNHYMAFVEQKAPPYDNIPSTVRPALKCLAAGIACLVLETLLAPYFHFLLIGTPAFTTLSFPRKILFLTIAGMVVRAKFYTVWKISEASALLSGVGVGLDRHGKLCYNAFENVGIRQLETGENVKACMDGWNKYTANWLRRYVYVRVKIPALKLPMTFFISAFWHGFYPGYYLSFLFSVPLTECGRTMRRSVRPVFLPGGALASFKYIYDILGSVLTMFCMNYLFLCFIVRRMDASYQAWQSIYFAGHVLFLAPIFLLDVCKLKRFLRPFQAPAIAKNPIKKETEIKLKSD